MSYKFSLDLPMFSHYAFLHRDRHILVMHSIYFLFSSVVDDRPYFPNNVGCLIRKLSWPTIDARYF